MDTTICRDNEALAETAAAHIVRAVNEKPDLVLCLPTGRTPLKVYRRLAAACRSGAVSFRRATMLDIDEYVGLGHGDEAAFATYMHDNLLRHVDADPSRVHLLDGRASDPHAEAKRYEALIDGLGGIDFLMLGIGTNGHIGFNEPGSRRDTRTRVVELAAETLAANAAELSESGASPTRAITIGLATILEARRIVVLASGAAKSEPLRQLFGSGSVAEWPVAVLRDHPAVTVLCDEAALAPMSASGPG